MVTVQVERDPKTGATVVRSVAPVSTPTSAPNAATVFDDGRMTIHAVGGSGSQPSTRELEQILSAVEGVGMKVMLDEVTNTPDQAETTGRAPEEKRLSPSRATRTEDNPQRDRSRSSERETEDGVGHQENRSMAVVRDTAGQVGRLEDVPVTLRFLGYTDATAGPDQSPEAQEGRLSVERVLITEDGQERVLSETCSENVVDTTAESVQGEGGDEGGGASKHTSCQCCSVM